MKAASDRGRAVVEVMRIVGIALLLGPAAAIEATADAGAADPSPLNAGIGEARRLMGAWKERSLAAPAGAKTPDRWMGAEPVVGLSVDVKYRCEGGRYRYELGERSASLGPALAAAGGRFNAGYLYPSEAGYSVLLEGTAPGARVSLADKGGKPVLPVGTVAPEEPGCAYEGAQGYTMVRIAVEGPAQAVLETKARTGILRPACYKNITEGIYVQELWKTLRLSWPQGSVELKESDSEVFRDREKCMDFYRWLTGSD